MNENDKNITSSATRSFQSIMHIVMGSIYFLIGAALMLGMVSLSISRGTATALGGLLLLYGLFRVVRGILQLRKKTNA
jgi:hypothetical protein